MLASSENCPFQSDFGSMREKQREKATDIGKRDRKGERKRKRIE
jgi:hypothetical protein